ncbi:MAG: NAD(P)H-hydrate dehydratase [Candidatus Altiarchaeota archaeon]
MDPRALDINAAWLGVSVESLMENAGRQVAEACRGYRSIAVFCGRGNNGGDGLVAARYLLESGAKARAYVLDGSDRSRLNLLNLGRLPEEAVEFIQSRRDFELKGCDLIVDALLGTGFRDKPKEPLKGIIEEMNESSAVKISVDVPSAGLVEADEVISLHKGKVPGARVVDIGIPPEAEQYCGPGDVAVAIPERKASSRKGDFGRLMVVGGSKDYIGTPMLVAQAALRAGCDLVDVCVPGYVADKMPFDPNLIVHRLKGREYVTPSDVKSVLKLESDALVFGNGLGRKSRKAVEYLMRHADRPVVVDADALSLADRRWVSDRMVLTPHQGEFKKLFGSLEDPEADACRWAKKTGSVIVLKGAIDVVSDGKGTRLNRSGNPYMTVGGTGDVLAGVIGGLLAQTGDRMKSACAGAFLSGFAGDIAAEEYGVSLVATDVISRLPDAIGACMDLAEESS